MTIQQEKPELETEKTRLLQQEEDKKIQLALLEESLLEVQLQIYNIHSKTSTIIYPSDQNVPLINT